MVSIIEMGQSGWWRGKRAWRVGSFPSQCVRRINCSSDVDVYSKAPLSPSANSSPVKPNHQSNLYFNQYLKLFCFSYSKTWEVYGNVKIIFRHSTKQGALKKKGDFKRASLRM